MKLSLAFRISSGLLSVVILAVLASAQSPDPSQAAPVAPNATQSAAPTSSAPMPRLTIGPGDEGDVMVYGVPDMTTHFRVSSNGAIDLPLIGKVVIGGMSADDAQAAIAQKLLDGGFVKDPHVSLTIKDYTNEGITVLGEVAHPGTFSAMNVRRLYDAFMAAGGTTPRAGATVTITHKGGTDPQEVTLSSDPVKSARTNIEVQPGDTIVVSRAGIVYVVGEVSRPGGFVLDTNQESLTITQLMAMSSGPTHFANMGHSLVIHRLPDGKIQNQPIDLKKILQAKSPDLKLTADDILWVPASKGKMAAEHGASSVLGMLTSLAIYRF